MTAAPRLYCTYFDSLYLARGIAMLRSLLRWDPSAAILVMALDQPCASILQKVFGTQVTIMTLQALHEADSALLPLRTQRTQWAFYATHKPAFLLAALRAQPPATPVIYIDADTWFFSSPEPVWHELGDSSIGLSPHRFCHGKQHLARYGAFNAGFLYFLANPESERCLIDWRHDCLAWCDEQPQPDGRFMNQGYLNRWPERYAGLHIIQHPGANLAPWNVDGPDLERADGAILVNGQPLIFYHFSATHRDENANWHALSNDFPKHYSLVVNAIYAPYANAVEMEIRLLRESYGVEGCGTVRGVTIGPDACPIPLSLTRPATPMKTPAAPLPAPLES